MRAYACFVLVLAGCFADLGVGGAVTPHAPPSPSGDGGYYRGGIGVGWGSPYGTLQASGDAMAVGHVAAIGGAIQASVFVDSVHDEARHTDAGWCVIARAFKGTGIGDSVGTEEYSLGFGLGGWAFRSFGDWAFDNVGLVFSAYRTTFADRDPMWSYGANFTFTVDPVILGRAIFREDR